MVLSKSICANLKAIFYKLNYPLLLLVLPVYFITSFKK